MRDDVVSQEAVVVVVVVIVVVVVRTFICEAGELSEISPNSRYLSHYLFTVGYCYYQYYIYIFLYYLFYFLIIGVIILINLIIQNIYISSEFYQKLHFASKIQ